MSLTLEPGKNYRTRDGRKARVICDDRDGEPHVIVLIAEPRGRECIYGFYPDGNFLISKEENPYDLTDEWTEPPTFDWSVLPAWCNAAIAQDQDLTWRCHIIVPKKEVIGWGSGWSISIPKSHAPKNYAGPWQDSLLVREGVV